MPANTSPLGGLLEGRLTAQRFRHRFQRQPCARHCTGQLDRQKGFSWEPVRPEVRPAVKRGTAAVPSGSARPSAVSDLLRHHEHTSRQILPACAVTRSTRCERSKQDVKSNMPLLSCLTMSHPAGSSWRLVAQSLCAHCTYVCTLYLRHHST